jgi:sugar O-acyltransferase (sialic acid O-acetyltransferase NeuD family)
MENLNLLIIGAGGHAKVVIDVALSMPIKWSEISFLDDLYPNVTQHLSYNIIGKTANLSEFKNQFSHVFVALGESISRMYWINEALKDGFIVPNLIHSSSYVSKFAMLQGGVLVCPMAVVNSSAEIGLGCIINTGSIVEHDCKLKPGVHVAPNATLAGNVAIGDNAWIGMGANILPNLSIGNNAVVGAGAVVCHSVDHSKVVMGIPAKESKAD